MDFIRFQAMRQPQQLAVTDLTFDRQWSYSEFDRFVAACVGLLLERGIAHGDRIACLSKNRAEIVALHLACARLGALFVPLNWRLSAAEIAQLIDDCEPALIFGDEMVVALDVEALDINALCDEYAQTVPVWADLPSPDEPSLLLYTSGTTGKPKGVLLSEKNLMETAINTSLLCEVDGHSGFLCEAPMFHIIGLATSVRAALLRGGRIVVSDKFIPERTLARLADPELNITHYFCVPQMALALRAVEDFDPQKLHGLKALFTGGAPHPAAQIEAWLEDGIAIVDGYGMSEAGTVFGMPLSRETIAQKAGSVGMPTPRVRARVADEKDLPVAEGVAGELQLLGDNISGGYWRREADYKAALTDDGWFRTGDIVTRDDDGFYWITDRKKDMYISGGENVYPAEVEAQLVQYPGIRELAVVGVPDEKWGEVGCLFYVAEGNEISLDDISEFLTSRVARYKIPQRTRAVEALPRNGVGKLLKHALRQAYTESTP